jgi:isopentenyldiphosphate isomerase
MPSDNRNELFDVVDEQGLRIGSATRGECHSNPALIHPVVHVLVTDRTGRVLLQKRALTKDTQPGKWDTSVGGHLHPGEDPMDAARRETREELGIESTGLVPLYEYVWRCPRETEYVRTFSIIHEGPFQADPEEIDELRFWSGQEIMANRDDPSRFTPNFLVEWDLFRARTTGEP